MEERKKTIRLILTIAAAAAALAVTAVSAYMLWERAPEAETKPDVLANKVLHTPVPAAPTPDEERGTAFGTGRQDGVYTLLLVDNDDGTGNTDTIMVGRLNTVRHTADFVSIPRDTLINVDTPIRKINSVLGSRQQRRQRHRGAAAACGKAHRRAGNVAVPLPQLLYKRGYRPD